MSQNALNALRRHAHIALQIGFATALHGSALRELPLLRNLFTLSFPLIQWGEIHHAH
ncbi:hypothetical protein PCAR4_280010 [Paraburkholderia caribensis]|nr:hypothetical protein PCAR4_280010 [Paraburkholderia caribensis]